MTAPALQGIASINVLKALSAVQDAHGYLLGNPTEGASRAMGSLREAVQELQKEIRDPEVKSLRELFRKIGEMIGSPSGWCPGVNDEALLFHLRQLLDEGVSSE